MAEWGAERLGVGQVGEWGTHDACRRFARNEDSGGGTEHGIQRQAKSSDAAEVCQVTKAGPEETRVQEETVQSRRRMGCVSHVMPSPADRHKTR